jgi:hypothetical protein
MLLGATRELQKTPQMLHQDDISTTIISAHFHTYIGEMFLVYAHVGEKYPGYHGSLITTQKFGYDRFPPAVYGWKTIHPISDKGPATPG